MRPLLVSFSILSYFYYFIIIFHYLQAFSFSFIKPKQFSLLFAKKPLNSKSISKNVENYLRMRDLERIKSSDLSYEQMKSAIVNGTKVNTNLKETSNSPSNTYQRYMGKGSLDQRLRAIVSYKRSINSPETSNLNRDESILSPQEEEELLEMMESESEEDVIEEDDEEAMYESLVLKAIEKSKLQELQRNFLVDKEALNNKSEAPVNDSVVTSSNEKASNDQDDLYTPARSSWGVFQRPRDISKSFGGGRVITKEEMQAMDEEFERRERDSTNRQQVFMNEAMKVERQFEKEIKDALQRSRGMMSIGNTVGAVELLESVKDKLSLQSELGSETLLEYGMALETVDRTDDARKIYGQLIASCLSSKTRRNALGLLQGLDITSKIRKDLSPRKPIVDEEAMLSVSKALEKGLRNEWDMYDKKDYKNKDNLLPWYDDDLDKKVNDKMETLRDAYFALLKVANPLKQVTSSQISRAFRRIYVSNDTEVVSFFQKQGFSLQTQPSILKETTPNDFIRSQTISLFADNEASTTVVTVKPKAKIKTFQKSDVIFKYMNGSWDLLVSMYDNNPNGLKRYEADSIVRTFDITSGLCSEVVPSFWGLMTISRLCDYSWNPMRCEFNLEGDNLKTFLSPFNQKSSTIQCIQVRY